MDSFFEHSKIAIKIAKSANAKAETNCSRRRETADRANRKQSAYPWRRSADVLVRVFVAQLADENVRAPFRHGRDAQPLSWSSPHVGGYNSGEKWSLIKTKGRTQMVMHLT